ATGENNAAVGNVGRQLGRRTFEDDADGVDDDIDAFIERFANFFIGNDDALRNAFHEVATLDFHRTRLFEYVSRPDFDLDVLRGTFTDEQVVLALDVLRDRFVHLVAGDLIRAAVDDSGQRNHS